MCSDIFRHGRLGFGLTCHDPTALPAAGTPVGDRARRVHMWSEYTPRLNLGSEGVDCGVTPHISHDGDPIRHEQQAQDAVFAFVVVRRGKRWNGMRARLRGWRLLGSDSVE